MELPIPGGTDQLWVPARRGAAARVNAGRTIRVINTMGRQVVDTWAFNANALDEWLSMEHTRVSLCRLVPAVGDTLLTNLRRPILSVVEDTTPGNHDMLMAACDQRRYELLGAVGRHDNCADNLHSALSVQGLSSAVTPSPLNLFMHVPWTPDGGLRFERSTCEAGQHVALRAEMDLIIVFSTCPQDMTPINDRKSSAVQVTFS